MIRILGTVFIHSPATLPITFLQYCWNSLVVSAPFWGLLRSAHLQLLGALWGWMEMPGAHWSALEVCPRSAVFFALFKQFSLIFLLPVSITFSLSRLKLFSAAGAC